MAPSTKSTLANKPISRERNAAGSDSERPARILVADDYPIVRLGLRQMITGTPDLTVCCEADTVDAAVQFTRRSPVDLAIVDLSLGGVSDFEVIAALRDAQPDLPVLVFSVHDESLFAERALRAGARGYITKRETVDDLLQGVRQVLAGKIYVSNRVSQHILEGIASGVAEKSDRLGGLTNRELLVVEMVGRGLATSAIAARLQVSVKTVETYRSNIKTKLHLKDANELVRFATSWVERF